MKTFERWEDYREAPDYINARVLAANVPETFDVPAEAAWVAINTNAPSTAPIFVRYLKDGQENLVTNGAFDSDTAWTKAASWTIAGGLAVGAGDGDLTQAIAIEATNPYRVVFTVLNRTVGTVTPKLGNTAGSAQSTNATFDVVIVAGATNSNLVFTSATSFDGDLDNVLVAPVAAIPAADITNGGGSEIMSVGSQPTIRGLTGVAQISVVSSAICTVSLGYYT